MLYDWPTWWIVAVLLATMIVGNELGFRVGAREHKSETELSRNVSNSLKASIFGLVALLLAFSFSATTNRYDLRQRLVLDQANAVGTCHQRAGLLPSPARDRIQDVLRQYVDARLEHYRVGHDPEAFVRTQDEINRRLAELWTAVQEANGQAPDAVRNALIVPAANEVIDLSSTRAWANRNHLPDPVLALLLVSVIVSSMLLGHSSGLAGRRHPGLWLASNIVFALVLYVVLDFDRPRRGLIRIDQTPLVELRDSFAAQESPPEARLQ
jgi:hypothetical protein